MKLFKHTVNHYFKNTKFISSFKIPKTFDKDFGQDIIKSITTKPTPSGKLRNLELSLLWFIKLKSYIPNFERNFLRSDFLLELMNFYDAVLSNSDEILTSDQAEGDSKQIFERLVKVNQHMMRIFNSLFLQKQNLEPESSEKKAEKSMSEDTEKKSAVSKDGKGLRKSSIRHKKSYLETLINIMAVTNSIYVKDNTFILLENDSVNDLIELLLGLLNENQDNIRQFLKLNGLSELLKIKAYTTSPTKLMDDLTTLIMSLVDETNLVMSTLEARIKTYITQRAKQIADIPLTEFINFFKNQYPKAQKQLMEVVQKLCIIYAKEADPIVKTAEQKNSKGKKKRSKKEQSKAEEKGEKNKVLASFLGAAASSGKPAQTEVIQRRFIKLKSNIEIGKLECAKKSSEKRKQKATDEIDLTDSNQTAPYTPSSSISLVLNILIEEIIRSFNEKIAICQNQANKEAPKNSGLFPYHALIKVLALLCHEYPLLLPYILNYNCAQLLSKDKNSQIPLLQKYANQSTFTFLSYYLRVINYIALDKFRYFLVSIASGRDTLIQKAENNLVFLGEEVARELVNEMKAILKAEISHPEFLNTAESVQSFLSVSSLLIALLPIRQLLKIVMEKDSEDKKEPVLLQLYVEAIKRLRLKNYYKLENVLPFIIEPCSLLIQYHNYITLNQPDLNNNEKYMPGSILIKHNFRDMWESLVASQSGLEVQLEGHGDRNRHAPHSEDPLFRNFFTRVLEMEEDVIEDEEDIDREDDIIRGELREMNAFGGMRELEDVMRVPENAGSRRREPEVRDLAGSSEGDEERDIEVVEPYLHAEGEEWQQYSDESLDSQEEDEDIEIGEDENENSEQIIHEDDSNLGERPIVDLDSAEFEMAIDAGRNIREEQRGPELVPSRLEEGDYDEEMNEKSQRSPDGNFLHLLAYLIYFYFLIKIN